MPLSRTWSSSFPATWLMRRRTCRRSAMARLWRTVVREHSVSPWFARAHGIGIHKARLERSVAFFSVWVLRRIAVDENKSWNFLILLSWLKFRFEFGFEFESRQSQDQTTQVNITTRNQWYIYDTRNKNYVQGSRCVVLWLGIDWFYPYPSGLHHLHWGNLPQCKWCKTEEYLPVN